MKANPGNRTTLAALVALATTATTQLTLAQESEKEAINALEEVVVTARKTEERLQDVPVAITAITGAMIEATSATGLEDIARQTPGFTYERTVGALGQPSMRGQSQSRITSPVQNVATFFNGIYLQRSYQIDGGLLGLERVEVIKGPQAALFGRNAFSGAINYVTKKPNLDEVEVKVEATYGSDEREELKGYVSIPFNGMGGISLAASTDEFDGTWENDNTASEALSGSALNTEDNLGGYDNDSYMVQLYLLPTDELTIDAFYAKRDSHIENAASYAISTMSAIRAGNTLNCTPFQAGNTNFYLNGSNSLYCGELPSTPEIADGEARPAGLLADRRGYGHDGQSEILGASVGYDLSDSLSLAFDYGHTESDSTNMGSLSGDPVNGTYFGATLFDSRGNGNIESDSYDLRVEWQQDGLRLMAGTFYSDVDDYSWGASFLFAPNSDTPVNYDFFPTGNLLAPGISAEQRDESVSAIYGLAAYDINDRLSATLEARYTTEEITQQAVDFATGTTTGTRYNEEFEYFTPRATVDYAVNADTMAYASVARGVKSGGFNTRATLASEQVYDPETNWTYELGVKGSLGDKLTYDAAFYYTDWTDMQGSRAQTGATVGTALILGNLDGAEVMGFEVSGLYRLTDEVKVNFGFAYSDAEYKSGTKSAVVERALCQSDAFLPADAPACDFVNYDVGGNQVARAPKIQANVGIAYDTELAAGFGLFARADYSYQDKMYTDETNSAYIQARPLLDASIGLSKEGWKLRLWGKNILDEEYVSFAFTTFAPLGQGSGVTYSPLLGDRRTVGATLSYEF
ncbi:TonB-dependent receptor [Halioxenophilus sp. WMMB6]|uniref:TonB-dependent receptor n=1 Tax=Halioxenophilus sp. WMMB6 TaxID=3073815 RepID=UPI00295F3934|nr:TonB-dependent receptor [Halioxenophilus sp. WMMB6]